MKLHKPYTRKALDAKSLFNAILIRYYATIHGSTRIFSAKSWALDWSTLNYALVEAFLGWLKSHKMFLFDFLEGPTGSSSLSLDSLAMHNCTWRVLISHRKAGKSVTINILVGPHSGSLHWPLSRRVRTHRASFCLHLQVNGEFCSGVLFPTLFD